MDTLVVNPPDGPAATLDQIRAHKGPVVTATGLPVVLRRDGRVRVILRAPTYVTGDVGDAGAA